MDNKLTDISAIVSLVVAMTHLKLSASCGYDRQLAKKWYEEEYLSGKHVRYVMKPDLRIDSVEDGRVYRAFNCDDAKAEEFMAKNPEYKSYFVDLRAIEDENPEAGEENPEKDLPPVSEGNGEEGDKVDTEGGKSPENGGESAAEPTAEELEEAAALKRSEAAKKAAETRAANKAKKEAEEAAAAEAAAEAAGVTGDAIAEFEKDE